MTDIQLPASGNLLVRWHPANAFANPAKPTPTEVNAGLKLGDSISWNDFDFGARASNTINDPAITAKSSVSDRGASQYGGSLSFYYPFDKSDLSNNHALVRAALKAPRTTGYITIQLDGELSETNTPVYSGGLTQTAQVGDFIHVFKVMTAGYSEAITGEEAFRYTISFLPQGELHLYATVAVTNTVVVTPASGTPETGDLVVLNAKVNGREFTRGVRWSSSHPDVASVSQNGIVTVYGVAAETATITAKFGTATAAYALTVGP